MKIITSIKRTFQKTFIWYLKPIQPKPTICVDFKTDRQLVTEAVKAFNLRKLGGVR